MAKESCSFGCFSLLAVCVGGFLLFSLTGLPWWACALISAVLAFGIIGGVRERSFNRASKKAVKVKSAKQYECPANPDPRTCYIYSGINQLNDGFPLGRISLDATPSDCPVCSAWEGKLVDLTSGQLAKYAPAFEDALKAGIFHADCLHRLEFVSLGEYPQRLTKEFGRQIGEPYAFGKYTKAEINRLITISKNAELKLCQAQPLRRQG